jgi:hypothetical protein
MNVSGVSDPFKQAPSLLQSSDLHTTAKRVLSIILILLERLKVEESVLMANLSPEGEEPVPYNTLRKYIRTLRYAGFDIVRKRLDGSIFYLLNDTKFHLDLSVQHAQGFEEWVTSLSKSSLLYRKVMMLVSPPFRVGFWDPHFAYNQASSLTLFEGKEHLKLLQDAIASKQILEFQLYDDVQIQTQIATFWARPYALTPFRQRDAVISAIHPYNRQVFHLKLSNIRQLSAVSKHWLACDWLKSVDYQLVLTPHLAKRYEIKPHETLVGVSTSGETCIQVSKELQYKALSRCVKYDTLIQVRSADALSEKIQAFQDLQTRILEETKVPSL